MIQYRPDIDGLRAVAILSVIAFHASSRLMPGGFVGVDLFFVISGYLITGILFKELEQGSFSFSDFYFRRIKRIFPALILVLSAVWFSGWFVLSPHEYKSLGRDILAGAFFVANIVLWNEAGYFDTSAESKPFLHLWSLGVEEQYYLLWPLSLFLFISCTRKIRVLICLGIVVSFSFNIALVTRYATSAFYLPHSRLWELLLGSLLAYVERGKKRLMPDHDVLAIFFNNIKAWFGILLISASLLILDKDREFPGWWALLPTFGALLLISAGMNAWVNRRVLANRWLVFVGLISYPLYLWHWPLFFLYNRQVDAGTRTAKFGVIIAAFLLAWLTYVLIEKPIRASKPRQADGRRGVMPLVLFSALTIIGCVGLLTWKTDGFLDRYPKPLQAIANYRFDFAKNYRSGECFLSLAQDENAFKHSCEDTATLSSTKTLLLLWGDSHSAHLYPGLKKLQSSRDFLVAQYSSSSCPPIIDIDVSRNLLCRQINRFVSKRIARLKPDIVLLAANWATYFETPGLARLLDTIAFLKSAGVERIVIIGPVPAWQPTLPQALFDYYRLNPGAELPLRMKFALSDVLPIDNYLDHQAKTVHVEYVSAYKELCSEEGCMTRAGPDSMALSAWDGAHLTREGAEYFVSQISEKLFP